MNAMSAALIVFSAAFACGADPTETTDEALLKKLLSDGTNVLDEEAAESLPETAGQEASSSGKPAFAPEAIEQLLGGLRLAEQGLGLQETGEGTRQAQLRVIVELERLIEATKRPKSPRQGSQESGSQDRSQGEPEQRGTANVEPTEQQVTTGEATVGIPTGPGSANQARNAEESSNRPLAARDHTERTQGSHLDAVRQAWGHLPPRLQEQLLNTGSDRYLPQYDALSRQYFESLARPDVAE